MNHVAINRADQAPQSRVRRSKYRGTTLHDPKHRGLKHRSLKPIVNTILLAWLALSATALQADEPGWLDRLLWNADERTQRGSEALEHNDYGAAAGAMEKALALSPGDARASYNAGTARLPLDPDRARALLEQAGEATSNSLAARAHYNLGNLNLESGDLQAAIDGYKNALRRDPSLDDAKFNLELAQKRLREQPKNEDGEPNPDQDQQDQQDQDQEQQDQGDQDQDQGEDNQDQQDQDQSQDEGDQDNQDEQDGEPEEDQGQENQDEQEQGEDGEDERSQDPQQDEAGESDAADDQDQAGQPPPGQGEQESPLPQFQDLEDMSAEEAAAILQAIENLEREQRKKQAEEAAKVNATGKKDW